MLLKLNQPRHLEVIKMLSCKNINKSYSDGNNKINVLNNINLNILEGETLAIIGASGSGKSTLLHVLSSLDAADSGKKPRHHQYGRQLGRQTFCSWFCCRNRKAHRAWQRKITANFYIFNLNMHFLKNNCTSQISMYLPQLHETEMKLQWVIKLRQYLEKCRNQSQICKAC